MQRSIVTGLAVWLFASTAALAQPISIASPGQVMPATPPMVVMVPAQPAMRGNLGGGFIEFLFGDNAAQRQVVPPPVIYPDDAQGARSILAPTPRRPTIPC